MKIALVSDTHLCAAAVEFNANLEATIGWIEQARVDLVIVLGDITADGVRDPSHLRFAKSVFERIPVPVLTLPGNHDIGDNGADAPTSKDGHSEPIISSAALSAYRQVFGPDYWHYQTEDWTLIGLNAQLFASGLTEEAEQWTWLQTRLASVTGKVGLCLHKPLFNRAPDQADPHAQRYLPLSASQALLQTLSAHDLRFVVSGHVHQTRSLHFGGVEHFWAPSTAFLIPDGWQDTPGQKIMGTLSLSLTPTHHAFRRVRPQGLNAYYLPDFEHVYPELKQHKQRKALVL